MSKISAEQFAMMERSAKKLIASRNIGKDTDLPEWVYQVGAVVAVLLALVGVAGFIWPDSTADFRYWLALNGFWW